MSSQTFLKHHCNAVRKRSDSETLAYPSSIEERTVNVLSLITEPQKCEIWTTGKYLGENV